MDTQQLAGVAAPSFSSLNHAVDHPGPAFSLGRSMRFVGVTGLLLERAFPSAMAIQFHGLFHRQTVRDAPTHVAVAIAASRSHPRKAVVTPLRAEEARGCI